MHNHSGDREGVEVVEVQKRSGSFYLCKEVLGPNEAFCPKNHYAVEYTLVFPDDTELYAIACTICAKESIEKGLR